MWWWIVGAFIFGLGVTLILLVVGASKLQDRHPTNRYLP